MNSKSRISTFILLLTLVALWSPANAQMAPDLNSYDSNIHIGVIIEPLLPPQIIGSFNDVNCHGYALWLAYGRTLPPGQGNTNVIVGSHVDDLIISGELTWLGPGNSTNATHVLYYSGVDPTFLFDPLAFSVQLEHTTLISQLDCFPFSEGYVQGRNGITPPVALHKVSDYANGIFVEQYFEYTPITGSLIPLTPQPALPTISVSATSATLCQGAPTTLTAAGSSNYTWSSSTGGTYSGSPITVFPTVTTTYTATGANGTCTSTPQSVTITVNPTPDFNLGGDVLLCAGDPFPNVCPSGNFGRGDSYSWSGPGILLGSELTGCYQPTQYGYYCLTVTNSSGCSTTKCVNIDENPNSSYTNDFTLTVSCFSGSNVTITANYDPLPTGLSQLVVIDSWNGYVWTNTIYVGTSLDLSNHTFIQGLTYRIRRNVQGTCFPSQWVTHTASCSASRSSAKAGLVTIDSEIEPNKSGHLNIYPNPSNGQFSIELQNTEGDALVEVYDMVGKILFSNSTAAGINKIDISEQPKGIYLVKITVGSEVFTKKVIYQ
jgi:hypothetical protein